MSVHADKVKASHGMSSSIRHHAIIDRFIGVYCREKHGTADDRLCDECSDLAAYAHEGLARCPYDPKPSCRKCRTHCYRQPYRDRMREVMRYSGIYFVKRGRIDWLFKYFLS